VVTRRREVLLIRQFRPIFGQVFLELPGGRIEPGESPSQAAIREVEEETGYEITKLLPIKICAATLGYSDEIIHLYGARIDARKRPGEAANPDHVGAKASWLVVSEAITEITKAPLADMKTLAALLLYRANEAVIMRQLFN
jgi:ADP-ribose pyrophosphatase